MLVKPWLPVKVASISNCVVRIGMSFCCEFRPLNDYFLLLNFFLLSLDFARPFGNSFMLFLLCAADWNRLYHFFDNVYSCQRIRYFDLTGLTYRLILPDHLALQLVVALSASALSVQQLSSEVVQSILLLPYHNS